MLVKTSYTGKTKYPCKTSYTAELKKEQIWVETIKRVGGGGKRCRNLVPRLQTFCNSVILVPISIAFKTNKTEKKR